MNWRFWKQPELPPLPPLPQPPPIEPAALATIAKAAVFNPTDDQQTTFGAYRSDAIARDIEQRRLDGREPHPDNDQMVAEAMSYAWMLVGGGKWTREHVVALEARLLGR